MAKSLYSKRAPLEPLPERLGAALGRGRGVREEEAGLVDLDLHDQDAAGGLDPVDT